MLFRSGFYYVVDVRRWRGWCVPFLWIGMNPITLYLASNVIKFRVQAQRFVGGGTLAQRIEQAGRLDPVSTVVICQQVAAGLDALHQAGVIHRDIKPENILLEGDTASIADLGLIKEIQGARLTAKGQALGTIDYIAPEQIRGDEITAAADVYALGCVAFACLLGRAPFADRSGMKVLWAHLQDAPPNPASLASDIPAGIGDAVLIALAKEPGRRPRSAGMFGQLLKMGLLG